MPKLVSSTPRYRFHKASGQALVSLNGRDYYLGPYNSKASRIEYDRRVGEWYAAGRQPTHAKSDLAVSELLVRYLAFAKQHFRKDGTVTREVENIGRAIRPLKLLYGNTLAGMFGPLALKALQARMIEDGLSRGVINAHVGRIKRIFKWAVSEELVSPSVLQGLQAVVGLQRNRTAARETDPVQPVAEELVDATLPHLPAVVADMVRFQRLVGCRPGEVRDIRPCDVDRSKEVWSYRPPSHKMEHRGRERIIFIGPRAQAILMGYLLRAKDARCFQPADSERHRKAELRSRRKTKVQPSQLDRRRRKPSRKAGDTYDKDAYARAIRRGCEKAFPMPENLSAAEQKLWKAKYYWSPNQLRHACATQIRSQFGLEAAQTVLGHSRADVTQIYAERDFGLAARVAQQVG